VLCPLGMACTVGNMYGQNLMLLYYIVYYRGADKSLARPTSRCFFMVRIIRLMLVLLYIYIYIYIYICVCVCVCVNSTNIPPIIIINRIYEHQNLLSL
jgi:hypothetical protein